MRLCIDQLDQAEYGLLYAVLERAVLDYQGSKIGDKPPPQLREQAEAWLFCWVKDDVHEAFSFPWICEWLDLNPYVVKRTLRKLLARTVEPSHSKVRYGETLVRIIRPTPATSTENECYLQYG